MFDDSLSLGAKLIIAYINGKIASTDDGKVELKNEMVARLIGTKIGKDGKRPIRQATRYISELEKRKIIKTKKGQHTRWVWFKKPDWTNMSILNRPEVSYMSSLNCFTFNKEKTKKSGTAAPDFISKKHPELDSFIEKIPFKLLVNKATINENLWNHGYPYGQYVLRMAGTKDFPPGYFKSGMEKFHRGYLDSPEHACAGFRIGVM